MALSPTAQELERRLGKPDPDKIRRLIRLPPEKRIAIMLEEQDRVLNTLRAKLRAEHPELSDLELTKLVFQQVEQLPIQRIIQKF